LFLLSDSEDRPAQQADLLEPPGPRCALARAANRTIAAGAAPIAPAFAPNRNREKETATSVGSRSAAQAARAGRPAERVGLRNSRKSAVAIGLLAKTRNLDHARAL